jgi:hypothetical protein
MEELAKKFAEYLGDPYVAAVGYAALAYGFFHWLDENASDEAKSALARTMLRFKDYKKEQVASALVEVFDRIYTYPLLRWRAFFRSCLITTVVSVIYVSEAGPHWQYIHFWSGTILQVVKDWIWLLLGLLFNVFTDYLSLFVIRPLLVRSGAKPVTNLALGAVSAIAIVFVANVLRFIGLHELLLRDPASPIELFELAMPWGEYGFWTLTLAWPAIIVFAWLPLFALGILTARLLTPLSWIVGRTQWFLREGKEHPLKAIGYVAAVVVFLGTVAGRAVFSG